MPVLRNLTEEEQRALIHKLRNSGRGEFGVDLNTNEILDEMVFQNIEKKMAKMSEEENYNSKNRYRLQRKVLDYADKKRMPIDERKLKDVLANRPAFRTRIENEIHNYDIFRKNPQFENGLLTYLNEASYGEMRDLIREVGINTDRMEFVNIGDL